MRFSTSPRLGAALAGRDNGLGALRLVLAAAVIIGHSWPLGGYVASHWERMADVAVSGFFALSGYLIAASRMRSDFGPYLSKRARRIFPGFWMSLAVVAFVIAPLAGVINGRGWDAGAAVDYVWGNATLMMTNPSIGATLAGAPSPGQWNGSLWTLMYEFAAYLLCGALLGIVWVRRHLVVTAASLTVGIPLLAWWLGDLAGGDGKMMMSAMRLFAFFAAGMLMYALRDRVPVHAGLVVVALAVVAAIAAVDLQAAHRLTGIPLAYALLSLGTLWRSRVGSRNDLSYGLYIYGWPTQQVIAMLGLGALVPVWAFAGISFLLTLPLAWLSWRLIERPAMRAGRQVPTAAVEPRPGSTTVRETPVESLLARTR